jgi:hypothetical protein
MVLFSMAIPVPTGKEAAVRQLAKDVESRWKDFEKQEKRLGAKRESWFLQPSSPWSLFIVHFEAKDPNKFFTDLAKSTDPFDVWWKDQLKQIFGLDLSASMTGPFPELLLSYGY